MSVFLSPRISVVIPTRNRPDDLRRCLGSLTRVRYEAWDLVLADQSDDDRTHLLLEEFAGLLPNVTYLHLETEGASRARNAGMAAARGEIVAFTDDDCTVAADWLERVAATFGRYPDVPLVYGGVRGAEHDWREYFVPVHEPRKERLFQGRRASLRIGGMTASMYVRRALWGDVGPFDVHLGAGALFFAGEDTDYTYRVLARGHRLLVTPAIVVHHHGARSYRGGAAGRLIRAAIFGVGAVHMKVLRSGDLFGLVTVAIHAWRYLQAIDFHSLITGRAPSRVGWIVMYARGLAASFRLGVDRKRCLYQSASETPPLFPSPLKAESQAPIPSPLEGEGQGGG